IGVCEVEKKELLEQLIAKIDAKVVQRDSKPKRKYAIAYFEGPDLRGIDVAFIYDENEFVPYKVDVEGKKDYIFSHEVVKRSPTRDILQVNLATKQKPDKPIIFIGNHWYARTAGVYKSEPYRIIAAETLSYWCSRINELHADGGWAATVVMGDFNGLPWERALSEYALSTTVKSRVKNAREKPYLLNLMWPNVGSDGTYYYRDEPFMLDQFLVSKGMFPGESTFTYDSQSVKIIKEDTKNNDGQPRRHGLPAKSNHDKDGFSDHFPISMIISQS
ncbi:MAG: hypothetical protein ACFFD9_04770, partial [Candidatus Thorarchaeota archaeon]